MIQRRELEGLCADDAFDAEWYLREYPDVAWSNLEPAEHYMRIGKMLGRAPSQQAVSVLDARHPFAKKARFLARDEVALVAHALVGRLKPHVLPYMKHFKGAGISVVLVAVVDSPRELLDEESTRLTASPLPICCGYQKSLAGPHFRSRKISEKLTTVSHAKS